MKWCQDVLYSLWARSLFWSNVSCSVSVLVFCYHFICSMMFDTVYICNTKWLFNPIMHQKSYLRLRIVGATAYINIKIKIKNLLLSYYVNYLLIDREKTKNIGGMYTQIYIYIYISVLYFFMNITCRSIQGLGLTEYLYIYLAVPTDTIRNVDINKNPVQLVWNKLLRIALWQSDGAVKLRMHNASHFQPEFSVRSYMNFLSIYRLKDQKLIFFL